MLLLTITWKSRIILQNIWRRVVDSSLMNISPPNIVCKFLLLERYRQNCQAVFAATDMNGVNSKHERVDRLLVEENFVTH